MAIHFFNSNRVSIDLPRSFSWRFLHDKSIGIHRAGSRFRVRGRGDYALLHLLSVKRRHVGRHQILNRARERGGS